MRRLLLIGSVALMGYVNLAQATIGTSDFSYGIEGKGLAGSNIALPLDSLSAALNPANIAFIPKSADVGMALFSPRRQYSANDIDGMLFGVAPGTHKSNSNYFLIPNAGLVLPYCCGLGAFGISIYGNGGLNTNYRGAVGSTIGPDVGVYGSGDTGIDFKQIFVNVCTSWKVNRYLALGGSALFVTQVLKVTGLQSLAPFSIDAENLSNRGYNYSNGVGMLVGARAQLLPTLAVGASYQPKIKMAKFGRYAGLFPNQGEIDIPAKGDVGLTFSPYRNLAVNFDVQKIWYEQVDAYGNPLLVTSEVPPIACFGCEDGSGFGWRNTTAYKFGVQWLVDCAWTVRAGFAHNNQPVADKEVVTNIVAPAVIKDHYTAGISKKITDTVTLNISGMYAPRKMVTGPNVFAPQQIITLRMYQFEVGASLTWLL